jgi:O-antigen/teichoic acid export membrane protein
MTANLSSRTIGSAVWNIAGSSVGVVVLFVRSVVLARLLPVETFGVYAYAGVAVSLTVVVVGFGMGGAFVHRDAQTEDMNRASAVHFTLKLVFTTAWASLLIAYAMVFLDGELKLATLVLTCTTALLQIAQTPQLILTRRIEHRRLAMIQLANVILTSIVALALASTGSTLWALLATDIVAAANTLVFLYIVRPVWRPKISWDPVRIRYFLNYGSRAMPGMLLLQLLDRIDDFWVGLYKGSTALGFYSRAYSFATYPRSMLATPVNNVATGTYAELKGDRSDLSRAFGMINGFLLRIAFLIGGVLALVAPEFTLLLLGEKWLPMVSIFRVMLIFTLLDPVKVTVSNLFMAMGVPEVVTRVRFVQLLVLVPGLFLLGTQLGAIGVAVAVDAMLIAGIVLLFYQARHFVDFSLVQLFGPPSMSFVLAYAGWSVISLLGWSDFTDWWILLGKFGFFVLIYLSTLLLVERSNVRQTFIELKRLRSLSTERP